LELRNVFEVSLRTRSSRAFLLQTEGSLIFYNDFCIKPSAKDGTTPVLYNDMRSRLKQAYIIDKVSHSEKCKRWFTL